MKCVLPHTQNSKLWTKKWPQSVFRPCGFLIFLFGLFFSFSYLFAAAIASLASNWLAYYNIAPRKNIILYTFFACLELVTTNMLCNTIN